MHARLIKHCADIGLDDYTLTPLCVLGMFFVYKKDKSLRMIVDCRKANQLFAKPPGVDLVTGEGLSGAELGEDYYSKGVATEEAVDVLSGLRLVMEVADVSDCFHRCRLAGSVCRYFCWPRVWAKYVGVTSVAGTAVDLDQKICPYHCSLPTGFSWALYFVQACTSNLFGSVPDLENSQILSDKGDVWMVGRSCL